jgi:hypothetical protein
MGPLFVATQPFGPQDGQKWLDYIKWSGLSQLDELVTLDLSYGPLLLTTIEDHYWPHIVNEDFMLHLFVDLEFLLQETARFPRKNILCVARNPTVQPDPPTDILPFGLLGYDLTEANGSASSVSALSNCGGFPDLFANDELTRHGLLSTLERALEVQDLLREKHPQEHHANCDVWSVSRADI